MKLLATSSAVILALFVVPVVQAAGDASAGKAKSGMCVGCHGVDGNAPNPVWPKLAGQSAGYIAKQLADFKAGKRKDPMMAGIVAGLSKRDMDNLGAYYERQKATAGSAKNQELAKMGERLYRGGNAKMGISACMSCHGPAGKGIPPRYPSVSGQNVAYAIKQLKAFKEGTRKNDSDVMTRIAFRMSQEEIKAVAEYMAGLH